MRGVVFSCVMLACLQAAPALAADRAVAPEPIRTGPAQGLASIVSELRFGSSVQDVTGPEEGTFNLTGEILFAQPFVSPDRFTNAFIPRPHVGASLNFGGRTSFAYAGLTWTFDIGERVFVEGSLGGAIHEGNTDRVVLSRDDAALGCSPLFRESASLGYRIAPDWSIMATVEHLSNAGFCSHNRGLTNIGIRIGHTF